MVSKFKNFRDLFNEMTIPSIKLTFWLVSLWSENPTHLSPTWEIFNKDGNKENISLTCPLFSLTLSNRVFRG